MTVALDVIRGSGGGGKGGGKAGGGGAKEAPDSLRSTQYAEVVDLLCEGEIEGLVDGAKSIFLDETPLMNENGTYNFTGVSWVFSPGTQDQEAIPLGQGLGSEESVNQLVKAATPVVRRVSLGTVEPIDAVRVTLFVPQMTHQNTTNGDLNGASVAFSIDIQVDNAGFQTQVNGTISGKTTTGYYRSYYIRLPAGTDFDVRVRRMTPDSTSSALQDNLYWTTYTRVIETKLSYPNSAVAAARLDAQQFSSIPSRAYHVRLLKVRVPGAEHYNPVTRQYTGIWNGSLSQVAWTQNPAWCWYDMVTTERYGLGKYIDPALVDKWALYQIARYCDELVPDGRGGMEPRFTCNLYLQTQEEAIKVVQQMAGIFRGMAIASASTIMCVQDRPTAASRMFSPANVIDGQFTYSGTAMSARHTAALVTWNDPADMYRRKIEYVEHAEGVARYGVRPMDVVGFGCTSQGQAHRMGRWALYTEQTETETVIFRAALDSVGIMPGDVIKTSDPTRSGDRRGGRLLNATTTQVTLDAPVTLKSGVSYKLLTVVVNDATPDKPELLERDVVFSSGGADVTTSVLNLVQPASVAPATFSMWVLSGSNAEAEVWRVLSVLEVAPNTVEVTALEHNPNKFAHIENNLTLETPPTSTIRVSVDPVAYIQATTNSFQLNSLSRSTRISLSWPAPAGAGRYEVRWRLPNEAWVFDNTTEPYYDIDNVISGDYEITVVAISAMGLRSTPTTISHTVDLLANNVPPVTGLLSDGFLTDDVTFSWDAMYGAEHYEVRILVGGQQTLALTEVVTGTSYRLAFARNRDLAGGPYRTITAHVRARTMTGWSSTAAALTVTNAQIAAPTGFSVAPAIGAVTLSLARPADNDYAGVIFQARETSGDPWVEVYDGVDPYHVFVASGAWEFRAAFYDKFDKLGLNWSATGSAVPAAAGGIPQVGSLPASPAEVGGELVVLLLTDRKLYRWSGTAWDRSVDGGDLLANSVTANEISVSDLRSISANLGAITSGSFTLDNAGFIRTNGATGLSSGTGLWFGYAGTGYGFRVGDPLGARLQWSAAGFELHSANFSIAANGDAVFTGTIRGGATNFSAGDGFWMGLEGGAHKWRVGVAGGARAEWNGSAFTIYDAAGNIALSTGGGIPWDQITGAPAMGSGGATLRNYLPNTEFASGQLGTWAISNNPNSLNGLSLTTSPVPGGSVTHAVTIWQPQQVQSALPDSGNGYAIACDVAPSGAFPVKPGDTLEFSLKCAGAGGCAMELVLQLSSDGPTQPWYESSGPFVPVQNPTYFDEWDHRSMRITIPANAVSVQAIVSKMSHPVGQATLPTSVSFAEPMLTVVDPGETQPVPYVAGPAVGAFSAIDKITVGNVGSFVGNKAFNGTFIADAAILRAHIMDGEIVNAKIGVAAVDYLRIQGNSIFVPDVVTSVINVPGVAAGDAGAVIPAGGKEWNLFDGYFSPGADAGGTVIVMLNLTRLAVGLVVPVGTSGSSFSAADHKLNRTWALHTKPHNGGPSTAVTLRFEVAGHFQTTLASSVSSYNATYDYMAYTLVIPPVINVRVPAWAANARVRMFVQVSPAVQGTEFRLSSLAGEAEAVFIAGRR